jgi:hypothetical protein
MVRTPPAGAFIVSHRKADCLTQMDQPSEQERDDPPEPREAVTSGSCAPATAERAGLSNSVWFTREPKHAAGRTVVATAFDEGIVPPAPRPGHGLIGSHVGHPARVSRGPPAVADPPGMRHGTQLLSAAVVVAVAASLPSPTHAQRQNGRVAVRAGTKSPTIRVHTRELCATVPVGGLVSVLAGTYAPGR